MRRILYKVSVSAVMFMAMSCGGAGGRSGDNALSGGDTLTSAAELLTLVDHGGYVVADVRNPWDTAQVMARYLFVPQSADVDMPLPRDAVVVRTPLESSLVYSGVHAGAIDELGMISAVTAVADGAYFRTPAIVEGLAEGRVRDVGSSMSPSVEIIMDMSPQAILCSPYENAGHGAIDRTGIPIIECADYMEPTPLGRAEWIKLLGVLYGNLPAADSIYRAVCSEYHSLAGCVDSVSDRPVVLTEQCLDGVWAVPGGRSYMARLIQDAGGVYPWAGNAGMGSLQLDYAAVFDKARHADRWLIRSYGPLGLGTLKSNNPLNARFDAFANGEVWVCDTSVSPLFDEFPFHPERLLRDYIAIFHPSLPQPYGIPRYYKKAG